MGIKLISVLLTLTVFVSSCSSPRKSQNNDFFVKEEDFLKAYKIAFLCGCLNENTKEKFNKFLKENNDLGLFSEGDLISHYKVNEADSLGRVFSKRIKPFTYGDGEGKMPNFSSCMYFVLGHEVDSLAKESYRQTLQNNQ